MQRYFKSPGELFEQKLQPTEYMIYSALLYYMNRETKQATPSVMTIASLTGLSDSTVRRTLHSLAEKGLMSVAERAATGGRCTSNVYTLGIIAPESERRETYSMSSGEMESSFDAEEMFQAALRRTQLEGV